MNSRFLQLSSTFFVMIHGDKGIHKKWKIGKDLRLDLQLEAAATHASHKSSHRLYAVAFELPSLVFLYNHVSLLIVHLNSRANGVADGKCICSLAEARPLQAAFVQCSKRGCRRPACGLSNRGKGRCSRRLLSNVCTQ